MDKLVGGHVSLLCSQLPDLPKLNWEKTFLYIVWTSTTCAMYVLLQRGKYESWLVHGWNDLRWNIQLVEFSLVASLRIAASKVD